MSVNREFNLLRPPSNLQGVWTPDKKEFLYISRINFFSLKFDLGENNDCHTKTFELSIKPLSNIVSLACDPNWQEHKRCFLLLNTGAVYEYDFSEEKLSFVHHSFKLRDPKTLIWGGVHCTSQGIVISITENVIVHYCTISKKSQTFNQLLPRKFNSTSMSVCPMDPDILALGSYDGLVVILSIKDMKVIHTFRGHDYHVSSFVWMRHIPLHQAAVEDDCFDIYSDEQFKNEFGAEKERKEESFTDQANSSFKGSGTSENFDFVEACQSLREDILGAQKSKEGVKNEPLEYAAKASDQELTDSEESIPSGISTKSNASSESTGSIENKFEKIDLNDKSDLFLISLDKHMKIWVWDLKSNCGRGQFTIHEKYNKCGFAYGPMMHLIKGKEILGNTTAGNLFHLKLHMNLNGDVEHICKYTHNDSSLMGVLGDNKFIGYSHSNCIQLNEFVESKNIVKNVLKHSTRNIFGEGRSISVSPLNPMRIAIGTKELWTIDVPEVDDHGFSVNCFNRNIKSLIVTLAWHPDFEEIIAFGTVEGRILIYNSIRQQSESLKPFCGEEIYDLAFGTIDNEVCLFATGNGICVYYSKNFTQLNYFSPESKNVSALLVDETSKTILIGNAQGYIHYLKLNDINSQVSVKDRLKLATNYIKRIRLNSDGYLAIVPKSPEICIFKYSDLLENKSLTIKRLKGHSNAVTWIDFNIKDPDMLVSGSYDSTIRLWSISNGSVISKFDFGSKLIQYVIFSPLNEKCLIVGTRSNPFYVFNTEHKTDNFPPILLTEGRRKENKEAGAVAKVVINNSEQKESAKQSATAKEESTILYLTKKESIKKSLNCITNMLSDKEVLDDSKDSFLNEKLFSNDVDSIKELLFEELQNHRKSNVKSVGTGVINQFLGNTREEILEHIQNKTLTDELVALSPMVSFKFWKRCTEAYACQLVDGNQPLKAVLHLLAIHEVSESIQLLCDKHFYREAWILAKLRKSDEDPIFEKISHEWIKELDYCGDYEAAALVCVGVSEFKTALELLEKRREEQLTEEHKSVILLLQNKE